MKKFDSVKAVADVLCREAVSVMSAEDFRVLFPSSEMKARGTEEHTKISPTALNRAVKCLKKELGPPLFNVEATYAAGRISNKRSSSLELPGGDISPRVIFVLQMSHFDRSSRT